MSQPGNSKLRPYDLQDTTQQARPFWEVRDLDGISAVRKGLAPESVRDGPLTHDRPKYVPADTL